LKGDPVALIAAFFGSALFGSAWYFVLAGPGLWGGFSAWVGMGCAAYLTAGLLMSGARLVAEQAGHPG